MLKLTEDDHLGKRTILNIERFHAGVQYLVPSGLKVWFEKLVIDTARICELGWCEDKVSHLGDRIRRTEMSNGDRPLVSVLGRDSEALSAIPTISLPYSSSLSPKELISTTGKRAAKDEADMLEHLDDADDNDDAGEDIVTLGNYIVERPAPFVQTMAGTSSTLRFICTPTQHDSGRSLFKRNRTLWAN